MEGGSDGWRRFNFREIRDKMTIFLTNSFLYLPGYRPKRHGYFIYMVISLFIKVLRYWYCLYHGIIDKVHSPCTTYILRSSMQQKQDVFISYKHGTEVLIENDMMLSEWIYTVLINGINIKCKYVYIKPIKIRWMNKIKWNNKKKTLSQHSVKGILYLSLDFIYEIRSEYPAQMPISSTTTWSEMYILNSHNVQYI